MGDNSWMTSFLVSWVSSKRRKKLVKNIHAANEAKRNIKEYLPSDIEGFFDLNEPICNAIYSGGINEYRCRAAVVASICAINSHIPVVVLHENNSLLEYKLHEAYKNSGCLKVVNGNNPDYEPFLNLSTQEVTSLVFNSIRDKQSLGVTGRYYINGISEFIKGKGIKPYCYMYITCPHDLLFDKIEDEIQKGKITSAQSQNIKSQLMQGQGERAGVENFFCELGREGYRILSKTSTNPSAISIGEIMKNNQVISIDVQAASNTTLINVIVNEIKMQLSMGQKLMVIVDNISLTNNELLEELLIVKPHNSSFFIVSEDFYAMAGADDNRFSSIVGRAEKYFIQSHKTGTSSTKWAEVIGYYEKDEVSNSIGGHSSFRSGYTYGNNSNISIATKREYVIRSEEINNLGVNEIYVKDNLNGELSHTSLKP